MGTDSKYLEEAMAELERSLGTFSDSMELTSLIVNNLENRLDNVKVTAKDIETGKKVYKYVATYESKPILVEDTGHYITLETGCYKWVEE